MSMTTLSMVFSNCLHGMAVPVARFVPGHGGDYGGRTCLLEEDKIRRMLTDTKFDFPDDMYITEHQLIKALGEMKAHNPVKYLPRPENF